MNAAPSLGTIASLWRRRPSETKEKVEWFAIGVEAGETSSVLRLEGRFTAERVEELQKALKQAWKDGRPRVVIDLSGCPFVDSAGLAALVSALQHANKAGRGFVLAGLSPQIWSLLRMARLDRVFEVRATAAAALAG